MQAMLQTARLKVRMAYNMLATPLKDLRMEQTTKNPTTTSTETPIEMYIRTLVFQSYHLTVAGVQD